MLIIGTGLIEAYDAGAKVIIIEKMPFLGGNSIRPKSGLNAADTSLQEIIGITDNATTFYNDTLKGWSKLK